MSPDEGRRADTTTQALRRSLRAAGREARAAVAPAVRAAATSTIVATLLDLPEIRTARRVLLTAAVGDELDLAGAHDGLRALGAIVALPVTDGDALVAVDLVAGGEVVPGWRGVPEPVGPPADGPVDVVLVPALAVDRHGGRLGYGGGHFDRYLAGAGAVAIGVVFDVQVVEEVPLLDHDVRLDAVVTERGVWRSAQTRPAVG